MKRRLQGQRLRQFRHRTREDDRSIRARRALLTNDRRPGIVPVGEHDPSQAGELGRNDTGRHSGFIDGAVRLYALDDEIEFGTVSMIAGTTSVAVLFSEAFSSAPSVVVTIERVGAVQTGGTDSVTTTGFTLRRSSGGGTVTAHWVARGDK